MAAVIWFDHTHTINLWGYFVDSMRDIDVMLHTGIYLNDLSLHDFSRDMVLAGQQQSAELKLALDQVSGRIYFNLLASLVDDGLSDSYTVDN